jgi:cellulose synthase/poly-beta-1,6-N-acetylglucosamine synthase-like glycosyltransferase
MTGLSVIIPVRNDAARLANCLASLRRQQSQLPLEIVVVDNGSTDESARVAAAASARVLHIPIGRVGELRNAAAANASHDVVAFVDADHEVGPTWLGAAEEAINQPGVGAAGALYLSPPEGTWVQQMYGVLRGRSVGTHEVDWLGSGNLVVRADAFRQVSGFDLSLEACEDVDLCFRLKNAGWKVVADERMTSVHFGDPPTLKALFRAERWRGRDNLRVSLRGKLTVRALASMLVPIITLASIVALVVGLVAGLWFGRPGVLLALAAASLLAFLFISRALLMTADPVARSAGGFMRALGLVSVYSVARSLALVGRAGHHRR